MVNLVHLQDVVAAIELLLQAPKGGHIYNLCAPRHPARGLFYPQMARELGLPPPVFSDSPDGGEARLWMAIVSAMSWGLSTSTPIRW